MSTSLKTSPIAYEPKVVQVQGLEFWTESFGNRKHAALILIMGSGGQGILWPQQFCEQLARQGYYVIRYDHRDTGLSATINYRKTPYNLLDMAKDVIGIMDQYGLTKAHIAGGSMGGAIAMLLGAHYPERVASLTLMMTTVDMRPVFDAFMGLPSSSTLSTPAEPILAAAKNSVTLPQSLEEKVELFIENARLNSGGQVPIDEEGCRQLALQSFVRMRNLEGMNNHFHAALSSHELHSQAAAKITAPTLVIHGDVDPVFPLDHAYALKNAIPHAELTIIPGLGHGLSNARFFDPIIEKMVDLTHEHA